MSPPANKLTRLTRSCLRIHMTKRRCLSYFSVLTTQVLPHPLLVACLRAPDTHESQLVRSRSVALHACLLHLHTLRTRSALAGHALEPREFLQCSTPYDCPLFFSPLPRCFALTTRCCSKCEWAIPRPGQGRLLQMFACGCLLAASFSHVAGSYPNGLFGVRTCNVGIGFPISL